MTGPENSNRPGDKIDPDRVAVVWMDAEQALVVRWRDDEPIIERLASGVPPRRRAVGSVRRGPARPSGGGRVPGHGTEGRHQEQMDRYVGTLARMLAGLRAIEVIGRGLPHEQFATLLQDLAGRLGEAISVTSETTSRRPSERQLMARLRKLVQRELPRQRQGRYRKGALGPTSATGRPTPAAAGRRTLRPAALPERREIDLEVEAMLSGEATGDEVTDH